MQRLVNETGLDLAITELDVRINPYNETTLAIQKKSYKRVVDFCVNFEKCVGVSVWGVSDRYSSITQDFDHGFWKPLMWDDNFQQKPNYDGVIEALS
jgi:endo-1,4-beta-xylanase